MTIPEYCRGYSDNIAKDSLCGIAAAVYLRLNLFNNDASPAFDWFHITQISSDSTLHSW